VAEVTIHQYVRERKRELGWSTRTTCVPQRYEPEQEGQVDSYEASAELNGEPVLLQVFAMRSMASGAALHRACHRATQQAFLGAHEHAFQYFGGVIRDLRYDDLKAALKKILRGFRREETARFIAFRSHWRFQSEFCTRYEAHEKGGIESEAGYFRRNHWVLMPKVGNLAELNAQLLAACHEDERRQIAGRNQPLGTLMIEERAHLLRWPSTASNWGRSRSRAWTDWDACGCEPISIRFRPSPAGRSRCDSIRGTWKCAMRAAASPATSAATNAISKCRSETLSRRAGAQAGRIGRIETAHGVAATRTMAGELRSALGGADSPARKPERHAPDD